MKINAIIFGLGLSGLMLINPGTLLGQQPDKKAAELKRLEGNIDMAKKNVEKYRHMMHMADSLTSTGTEQANKSKAELKELSAKRKVTDKDYATHKKEVEKRINSKDKAESTAAKTESKDMDTKYRAEVKDLENREREATRMSSVSAANLTKGKNFKKTAEDGLKTSQAAVEAAQAKYNAAAGLKEEDTGGKKKKK
jgi:hypothetical protein